MTKLEMILQIVDWEHRYKGDHLMGGGWCLRRIRELNKMNKAETAAAFKHLFG